MAYTVQQEHQIRNLIRLRRKELQDDREHLEKPMSFQIDKQS